MMVGIGGLGSSVEGWRIVSWENPDYTRYGWVDYLRFDPWRRFGICGNRNYVHLGW